MRKFRVLLPVVLAISTLPPAQAQEGKPTPEDPVHEELRTLRRQMIEAINKNDIDALLTHLDQNVVVTWMDARVSRGPQAVKEYLEKMTKGENRKVNSYKTEAEVEQMKEVAKSSLYQMKMEVFNNDANAFLRYTMAKELNQDLVLRLFHAGPGTFWTNMGDKNMNFLMPVPPTEKKEKGAKGRESEPEPKK